MLLLDDGGGDGGEAAACRCGAGIRSEKRARSGRVRNGGEGGGAHTAYEEEDEPLPDDVSEAGGHEGAGNSRFVTSPSARRRFATPRWATSASRASCIQKLGGTRLPSVHCFSSRCYYLLPIKYGKNYTMQMAYISHLFLLCPCRVIQAEASKHAH